MRADLRGAAEIVVLGAAVASIAYAAFAIVRLSAFERSLREPPSTRPPMRRPSITVLKPVRGLEPRLEENLRSFCTQDYPDYHVVLGVHDASDPALEVLQRIAAEFPDRTTVVAGDGAALHRNPKLATLAPMLAHAHGEILVIADSDMRVDPSYLAAVAAPFDDARVGAVTAVYRGEPAGDDLASVLGAMWITEQFAPSVLVAAALEPLAYTFGATMAVRRTAFDAIGGARALGARLADDHALGHLVTERGLTVALARCVVENLVSEAGWRALAEHELRWARTIRTVRGAGYLGLVLTYPVPLALLHLVFARRRRRALALLVAAVAIRAALGATASRALGARRRPPAAWFLVRDALGIGIWILGLTGRTVRWRDDPFRVTRHGEMV